MITDRGQGRVVTDPAVVPPRPTVIVPGAWVEPGGEPGSHVGDRLEAATALVELGTVSHILISGDNRESHYNEPVVMHNWLVEDAGLDPGPHHPRLRRLRYLGHLPAGI